MFGKRRKEEVIRPRPYMVPDSSSVYLGNYSGAEGLGDPLLYKGERHQVIIGPNGSGKSMLLIANLLRLLGVSIVLPDMKGQLTYVTAAYRATVGRVIIVNPCGVLGIKGTGFNPLVRIDPDSPLFYAEIRAIAEALIREERKDPHWTLSAEDLLASLVGWEIKLAKEEGRTPLLANVRKMLTEPDDYAPAPEGKRRLVGGFRYHMARMCVEGGDVIADLAGRFLRDSDEMASVRSTAIRETSFLLSPQMRENLAIDGIDFRTLKDTPTTCYAILPPEFVRSFSGWYRLIVTCAIRACFRPGGIETLFMLDEFAQLGHLKAIEDALPILRGYGVRLLTVLQDLAQLDALYGEHRAKSFIANAGTVSCFAANDMDTAEWMSRRAGDTSVVAKGFSEGDGRNPSGQSSNSGFNYQQIKRRLILPQEMFGFAPGSGLLWTNESSKTIPFVVPPYWQMPGLRDRAIPDPYHQPRNPKA